MNHHITPLRLIISFNLYLKLQIKTSSTISKEKQKQCHLESNGVTLWLMIWNTERPRIYVDLMFSYFPILTVHPLWCLQTSSWKEKKHKC